MKLALSTHLLAYHPFRPEFADWIRETGFATAEIWCMNPHFPYRDLRFVEGIRRRFESVELRAGSVHLPFYLHLDLLRQRETLSPLDRRPEAREKALDEAEAAIDAAAAIGARVAVLHLGEPGAALDPENESLALRAIERLGARGKRLGVTIALENILSDLTRIDSLRALAARAGVDNVGICLDVGHSRVAGDPAADARNAGDWLRNTHLHDNDGSADQHRPPGEGSIDWAELTQAFRAIGYQGWHNLEVRDTSRGGEEPQRLLVWVAAQVDRVLPFRGVGL